MMQRVRTTLFAIGFGATLLGGGTFLGAGGAWAQDEDSKPDTYELLDSFGEVFERIRKDYVEEVEDEELLEAAIQGMLRNLDPHSSYLNQKNFQSIRQQTRGEFGGLGIEVTLDETGYVRVVAPIDDTPAFRAGIQSGDLITELDGVAVQGLTLGEAVEKMRGEVGSDIVLTILRGDQEPFEATVTRDRIKVQSVRHRIEGGDIGYLRISSFTGQTQSGLDKAIASIKEEAGEDLKGFILDLRSNPGGLLDQAISVSDTFLEKGEVVSTRGRDPENAQRYHATPGDQIDGLPLIVLINGGSASASEIVAGALQDHGRAIVLGTQSFGKGSVQTIMQLSRPGTAIKLTTQRYYTPSGRSIQQKGISPDILVERARVEVLESGKLRSEADLRGALTNDQDGDGADAGNGGTEDSSTDADVDETVESSNLQDYQLARALDLMHGIALYRNREAN
ncbi:S41 family peptidase [Hwanghaeella grinnelliae]|uniref:S41 family peptidase n=1 Tax=Hwanghaeella grinnelliae TaxID=2500179 RepID=A0A3S2Z9E7_9PROT|nr:S41 family peptidase [Hwanghaeella grinnelliae]RVU36679.1 S41 family peptidase [Hwanghaeella grinnelliae]